MYVRLKEHSRFIMATNSTYSEDFYDEFGHLVVRFQAKYDVVIEDGSSVVSMYWNDPLDRNKMEKIQAQCLQLFQSESATNGRMTKLCVSNERVSFYCKCHSSVSENKAE